MVDSCTEKPNYCYVVKFKIKIKIKIKDGWMVGWSKVRRLGC